MVEREVKVYPRFERFWHWTQMLLILLLLVTGLRISGLHALMPFKAAFAVHTLSALALIVLWLFAIFWHVTTGTWVHYVPRLDGVFSVLRYYTWGIFKGEHHPYRKRYWRKHNPLQVLAYLVLKLVLFPAIWISGLLYVTYTFWSDVPEAPLWLELVANIHLLAAYAILAFVIAHVYLLTTGHSFREHVRPMLTGYDTVALSPEEEAYLEADEPARIRPKTA